MKKREEKKNHHNNNNEDYYIYLARNSLRKIVHEIMGKDVAGYVIPKYVPEIKKKKEEMNTLREPKQIRIENMKEEARQRERERDGSETHITKHQIAQKSHT